MEVGEVLAALSALPGAAALCREDLEHGARLVLLPGLVDAGELRSIYRRRAEHLAAQGTEAADAFDAAERLDASTYGDLVLGKVEGGPSGQIFQLFLAPEQDQVVACVAVAQRSEAGG